MFRPADINRDQISLQVILLNVIKRFTLKIKFIINVVTLKILKRNIYFAETAAYVPHYCTHFITHNRVSLYVSMFVSNMNCYYV
jgi:hypothetical protein